MTPKTLNDILDIVGSNNIDYEKLLNPEIKQTEVQKRCSARLRATSCCDVPQ